MSARHPRLQGQVALVTAAASGIGAVIAAALCDAGARVVLSDIDEARGRATAARLGAEWMPLDLCEERAWIVALARLLDSHGRLDVLVNNAAVTERAAATVLDPEHASLQQWHALRRDHLDGIFLGCKHGLRAMRRGGGGRIVNVVPATGLALMHSRGVAQYCAEQGLPVRCNTIHPGSGHGGPPAVGALAVLLASPEARALNGQAFSVDSGPQSGLF